MIQRVQSIFLFLIAVCMIITIFLANWQETSATDAVTMNAIDMLHTQSGKEISKRDVWYIAALAAVAAGVALFSLFSYKNRTLQTGLGAINALIMAGVLGLIIYFSREAETIIPNHEGSFQTGTYLPMAAMICNIIANRFIRRDEKLVRSADRMR